MRKAESGQVIFKDSMSSSVAAIVKGDYRGDGADQVVVCAVNGEVRHIREWTISDGMGSTKPKSRASVLSQCFSITVGVSV